MVLITEATPLDPCYEKLATKTHYTITMGYPQT